MAKRHKQSLATRRKISAAQKGRNNSFYGKTHSTSTLKRLRAVFSGKGNPMFGKTHSPEARRKISLAARRRYRA